MLQRTSSCGVLAGSYGVAAEMIAAGADESAAAAYVAANASCSGERMTASFDDSG